MGWGTWHRSCMCMFEEKMTVRTHFCAIYVQPFWRQILQSIYSVVNVLNCVPPLPIIRIKLLFVEHNLGITNIYLRGDYSSVPFCYNTVIISLSFFHFRFYQPTFSMTFKRCPFSHDHSFIIYRSMHKCIPYNSDCYW